MHRLRKFNIISILFFMLLLFGASSAMAITFSFDSYQVVIVEEFFYRGTLGGSNYGIMNGEQFTNSDINPLLDTYTYIDPSYPDEVFVSSRGSRTFDSATTQIDFNTSMLNFDVASNSDFNIGEEFLLGVFTFTNGSWLVDPEAGEFNFTITASSAVAGLVDQTFSGTLMLHTNSNGLDTPEERADWFYIEEKPEFVSVRVLEIGDGVNSGSIELWGAYGSLDLLSFRNPTGGAFLNDSVTSELVSPVPEPSTILLLGTGLVGLAGFGRRKFFK